MGAEEYYGNHGNGNHLGQQVGAEVEKPAVRIKVSLLIYLLENAFYDNQAEQADSSSGVKRGQAASSQCNGGTASEGRHD